MAYTIYKTNGQFLTTIADGTINRGSTSVALPGRNYSGYGLYIDQDLVYLLENFAGNTVPNNPIAGQLWYDTSVTPGVLKVCPADDTTNPADWQELALGGTGANASFSTLNADNIIANTATITDITAANSIQSNGFLYVGNVGSPTRISLNGSTGLIQAALANLANITTGVINAIGGNGTINNNWNFTGNTTFQDVDIQGSLSTTGGLTIGGDVDLTNANITNLRIPGNPATTQGNVIIANSTVTFGSANTLTAVNAVNANVSLGYSVNANGVISNLSISGNAQGNALGTSAVTDNGNIVTLTKNANGNLQWRFVSSSSIAANVDPALNIPTNITTSANLVTITAGNIEVSRITPNTYTIVANSFDAGSSNTTFASLGVGVTASGTLGEIRASNDVTAYYSSDARLKTNIRPIENALASLKNIRGVRYDWVDEYIETRGGEDGKFVRKHDVGVIAQEVEQILPEIVSENATGYKAVKYERLVSILIEAVKELALEVEALKSSK